MEIGRKRTGWISNEATNVGQLVNAHIHTILTTVQWIVKCLMKNVINENDFAPGSVALRGTEHRIAQ